MMEFFLHDLGRRDYASTLALQRQLLAEVQADPTRAHLLLVEHEPVITLGRRTKAQHVLATDDALAACGIAKLEVSRGGDVTYHGPGQLVCYPIIAMKATGRSLHDYVHALEYAIIDTLAGLGVRAFSRKGLIGVWTAGGKIAAIGVAVERWVCWHGLALNVCTDLCNFDLIVPCGLTDTKVTSMSLELGRAVTVEEVKRPLVAALCERLGVSVAKAEEETKDERPTFNVRSSTLRLPPWLKKKLPTGPQAASVRRLLSQLGLATVCSSAKCPNMPECFARRTATFLILGDVCTRRCRFCAVGKGAGCPPREDEPAAVAAAAAELGLRHVVVTSVTRDDLGDGGAVYFARTITAIRDRLPQAVVEVLIPDFAGSPEALEIVLNARPDVLNHNIETVPRLYPQVRPQAIYARSLELLRRAAAFAAGKRKVGTDTPPTAGGSQSQLFTKSGLMVGLGETHEEVLAAMRDLRVAGCDILTIGQYLRPSGEQLPVARFVEPAEFEQYEREGREMDFRAVQAGPFVRSSYLAEQTCREAGTDSGE